MVWQVWDLETLLASIVQMLACVGLCLAMIYFCIPRDHENTTRCVINLVYHKHLCEESISIIIEHKMEEKVLFHLVMNSFTTAKKLETTVTKDVIS